MWRRALVRLAVLACASAALPRSACAADGTPPVEEGERGDQVHARLRELVTPRPGRPLKVPVSPRFVAVADPGSRGTRLVVGWLLPGLSLEERLATERLPGALGPDEHGHLPSPLAWLGKEVRVEASLEEVGATALLCVDLWLPRAGAGQDIELALLATVRGLAGADTPVGALVRRHLTAASRSVVEVVPPALPVPRPRFAVSETAPVGVNRAGTTRPGSAQKRPR